MTAKKPVKRPVKRQGSKEKTPSPPLDEVEKLMLDHSSNYVVSRALVEQYGIDPRTARRWIQAVREEWRKELEGLDYEEDRAFYRANLLDLYAQAKEAGNLPIALSALARYATFQGLDKPQVQHVEHHVSETEHPSKWEPGTAARVLERLGMMGAKREEGE